MTVLRVGLGSKGAAPHVFQVVLVLAPRNIILEEALAELCRDPRLLPGLAEALKLIVSMSSMAAKQTTALQDDGEGEKGGKGAGAFLRGIRRMGVGEQAMH